MRISRGHGGLRASVIIAMTVWPSAGNGTTTTSKASQVIEILVIGGGVPLSESRGNRPMPGKVEWLRLAQPNRIPFQIVDQGVAGMDPQFVADFLGKSGLALAGKLAGRRITIILSLLPYGKGGWRPSPVGSQPPGDRDRRSVPRSEEHTSELQSRQYLVCRL